MKQGTPHGAHVRPFLHQMSRTRPPGPELFDWKPAINPGTSRDSSFISVEEHIQYTTAALRQRDAPSQIDPNEDVVSLHNDSYSDVEMVSTHEQQDQHTEDSSPDSSAEDIHNPSDNSDMESDQDQGSSHHSDSSSGHDSNPGSNLGSKAGSVGSPEANSDSSDENGGDFMDMFREKRKDPGSPRNQSHGHNPAAAADPRRQTAKNNATSPLQAMLPIWISRIRKRRNLNARKLPPRTIARWNPPRIR